ncbi:MAG: type I-B CRISPR-associated protein Cas8b1/Cst1 [Blastochloris sp.]|nr:type I-B CRISPR-associated protein Cas8b1/Cst1 [Blastochloris sp.]
MLRYTGHPFIDIGLATLAAYAGKRTLNDLTVGDLERAAQYIEANYVRPPLRGHLTMAFTSNAWFIQDAFNPDKPGLPPEKRKERQATRDRWANHHCVSGRSVRRIVRRFCVFTGLPAATKELSGKLAPGRIGRNQMPLLQGDDAINFFTGGAPGLPIASEALLALQFMPMGCAKVGVGMLAVHADSPHLTVAFAREFLKRNQEQVLLMQAAQEDKLPGSPRALKTLLIEVLLEIELKRRRDEQVQQRTASITAYNFNNGKSPQLVIYHLPLQITGFLSAVQTPTYKEAWQRIEQRSWQQVQPKVNKKGEVTEAALPKHNYLYEDLFALPQAAARFVRTYFLRWPQRRRFEDDPRTHYSPRTEQDLIHWPLVQLFLKEVLTMSEERIDQIKVLGDKLAGYTRSQGGKRFFRQFFVTQKTNEFLALLLKTNIAYTKFTQGRDTLFDLDTYVDVFMDGDDLLRPDWRLARDLVLIRMIEQLKDWLAADPDAIPDTDLLLEPAEAEARA